MRVLERCGGRDGGGDGCLGGRFGSDRSSGGLLGVRQRVSELGGSVELRPNDAGTTIVVALPR